MKFINIKTQWIGLLCLLLLFFSSSPSIKAANPATAIPVHLKAGMYSILYTYPSAPYIDAQGRLLIPLRTIEGLFGGVVSYNASTKIAVAEWLGHSFEVAIGSKNAKIDGKPVVMDTIPVNKKGSIYLPIRLLLDGTDLEWTWNNKTKQLSIDDERVLKGKPFQQFEGNDFADVKNEDALTIMSYVLEGKSLTVTAVNHSGHTIPDGKADIQPLVSYSGSGGFSVDSYSRPSYLPLKGVLNNQETQKSVSISPNDIEYIITVGRELN
ncbi:hypothetical protein BK133_29135 [Paenibacillus sp. FSL H8-0548]|uniref:copper amine oxidase N-terminal domain-containing protein n=1 Tax=Paenibacillus sp. FSL H8-0548 TaxID=1920422 RepID=UPI00096F7363|nr:copper amine oxidase N-terminal domain-containing protein [Paenibacillus sp. FSL H8-0548]OMF20474.1 hypothetical protein BK133_29135 [Paenibacillus sp. FSL H8-0548]